jgi:succinyl-CoA synthetase beta subunit
LKLYEYEAKSLLAAYNVPIPKGEISTTSTQALEVAKRLGKSVAVKAQVLVAGRGKAGGILFADSPPETKEAADKLLNSQVKEETVTKLLVEEKISVKNELYFGLTIDRLSRCFVAMASKTGGVDIEQIAEEEPQKILKEYVNPRLGFRNFQARQLVLEMGYGDSQLLELTKLFEQLYRIFVDFDAELIEVNPFVETVDGEFVAADARIILDDNALFRHEEFKRIRLDEPRDLTPQEFEALKTGLAYVKLGGDIGIVGNGAGLVMATIDIVKLFGGRPANFLDMGGGAPFERVKAALKLLLSDPEVKVLFVNILGGITLCDEIARSIIQTRKLLKTSKMLVVRLVGTNEAEGKRILSEAKIPFFDNLELAAQKAVELSIKET